MNQTQFSDLDEEIIADDWLVPQEEISRRRLFKQTTKYRIYKADWFGDVLVYEPRPRKSSAQTSFKTPVKSAEQEENESRTEELRLRLANLDLDISRHQPNPIAIKKPQGSLSADSDQADSAYSSISSTPHYHSKNLNSDKFEFPQQQSKTTPSFASISLHEPIASNEHCIQTELLSEPTKISKAMGSPRAPVILNKDSYVFGFDEEDISASASASAEDSNSGSGSSWQELNELRLIAHESFMLFMGASVVYETTLGVAKSNSTTSLVMQMNHPKAVSLHNLLRGQPQHLKSPIDR